MNGKSRLAGIIAIFMILLVCAVLSETAGADNSKRVLVGFKKDYGNQTADERGNLVRNHGGEVHRSFRHISAVSAKMSEKAIAKMKQRKDIAYIEEDSIVQALQEETPWGVNRIDAPKIWGTSGGAGVNVAVLDSGIDYDHPDLAGNIAGGVNLAGFSGDGGTSASDWNDKYGHGTHCAGIIAAADNDIGVVGVAPNATLWAVKVLGDSGSGYISDIIQGLEWCIDNGMDVVSMSLGGYVYNQSLKDVCDRAYAAGVLLVAAAGNESGGQVLYPAAYGSVIAVSAMDSSDSLASFSSVGPEVELTAPGVSIKSTYVGGGYQLMSGTSMACPHTAGVAALVIASGVSSSTSGVRQRLIETAEDIGLASIYQGNGLVDAEYAVGGSTAPVAPVANFTASPTSGQAPLNVSFTDGSTGSISSWAWTFGDGGTSNTANPSHTYGNTGTYTVTLTVTGPGGSDSVTRTSYIVVTAIQAPVANFTASPTSGQAPLNVSFTNGSTGSVTSWVWNFGDGGTSSTANPSHTYGNAGTYTVTLTVTGPGGSDYYTRVNYVTVSEIQAPVANFSASPTSGQAPLNVSFTDGSTGSIAYWAWTFGDGGTSSTPNPSHVYESAGSYTAILTVTGPGGSSTHVDYISVEEAKEVIESAPYVDSITLRTSYRGSNWRVTATVVIKDTFGNPVGEVQVHGIWSGTYNSSVSGQTGGDGIVTFSTPWMKKGGSVTFIVDYLMKSGVVYDAGAEGGATKVYKK